MDEYQLLGDLHKLAKRQGPGGDAETDQAIALARLDRTAPLKIADIGCGTGGPTLQLARSLNAKITAIDFLPDFIEQLKANAAQAGLLDKLDPQVASMENLPLKDGEYDVIWSEGAIYNIGFEQGIRTWRRFLKPGGRLVVSEITWTTHDRPAELEAYWKTAYPEIDTAAGKIKILEAGGYSPIGYFVLPEYCWLENYYRPLQSRFAEFLARHGHRAAAKAIVDAEQEEITLYEKYKAYYSYGVYIAVKCCEARWPNGAKIMASAGPTV